MIREESLELAGISVVENNADGLPPRSAVADSSYNPHWDAIPQLDGYTIVNRLGAGGMGSVWRAVQISTRREVAVKFLNIAAVVSEKARRRFEREIDLAGRLIHPNIARVYDSNIHLGEFYYAMELIDGVHLDAFVRRQKLRRPEILKLFAVICRAVQYAHQMQVIHRDLKPGNILVDGNGIPHILDFGLGKSCGDEPGPPISIEGEWAGTPAFMSPEQAAGKVEQLDTRTDIYSLGVVLYHLLTDRFPHDSTGGHLTLLNRIVEEEIVRPRKANATIDGDLEAILFKALAKRPDDRYASAGMFADDIDNYLKGEPVTAHYPSSFYFLRKKVKKYRVRLSLVGLAVLVLATVTVRGSMQVAHDRNLAITTANEERSLRHIAELRLAEGLVSWGDRSGATNDWATARKKYREAYQIHRDQNVTATNAELGLLESYRYSPRPLAMWGLPDGAKVGSHSLDLVVDPDQRRVWRAWNDGTIYCNDLLTGHTLQRVGNPLGFGTLLMARFGDDGRVLGRVVFVPRAIGAEECFFEVLNPQDGTVQWRYRAPEELCGFPAFSSDGYYAAFAQCKPPLAHGQNDPTPQELVVINLREHKVQRVTPVGVTDTLWLGFSANCCELLIFYDDARTLTRRSVTTGAIISSYKDVFPSPGVPSPHGDHGDHAGLVAAPDGSGVLVREDSGAMVFFGLGNVPQLQSRVSQDHPIYSAAFSPDAMLVLTGDQSGQSNLWEPKSGYFHQQFVADQTVVGTQFVPSRRVALTEGHDGSLQIWPLGTEHQSPLRRHPAAVTCLAISPDNRVGAAGLFNGDVEVVDLATGRVLQNFHLSASITSVAFAAGGKVITAATNEGQVSCRELLDSDKEVGGLVAGTPLKAVGSPLQNLRQIQVGTLLSPNGEVALGLTPKGTVALSVANAKQVEPLDEAPNRLAGFSSDSRAAVVINSTDEPTIDVFNLNAPKQPRKLPLSVTLFVSAVALSPDKSHVFLGCKDGTIDSFDVDSGRQDWSVTTHRMAVQCLSVSPDGQTLLSGGDDRTLRLWDAKSGRELRSILLGGSSITTAAFSPDGQIIWCNGGSGNGTYIWDLSQPAREGAMESRAAAASERLQNNPDDAKALADQLDWLALCQQWDWGDQLLKAHDCVASLATARIRWLSGDSVHAATDFESLIDSPHPVAPIGYLVACRDSAKGVKR